MKRWPAIAFLMVVVLLGGWNVHAFVRNQREFPPYEGMHASSGNIEKLAASNMMLVVSNTFATYHRLRRLFRGKTILISSDRGPHVFSLVHMGQVRVELVYGPRLTLPDPIIARLIDKHLAYSWALDPGTPLGVVIAEGATRYVLVQKTDRSVDMLVPEDLYLRAKAGTW